MAELQEVGGDGFWFPHVLGGQAVANRRHLLAFAEQGPDPHPGRIEPEVAAGFDVQQHRFAVELAHQDARLGAKTGGRGNRQGRHEEGSEVGPHRSIASDCGIRLRPTAAPTAARQLLGRYLAAAQDPTDVGIG